MESSQGHNEKIQSQIQPADPQYVKDKEPEAAQKLEEPQKSHPKLSQSKTKKSKVPLKSQIDKPISQQKHFAPFLAKTLYMKVDSGFGQGAISYNEKHNIIIACPQNKTVQFFNATTLLPLEGMKPKKLESYVVKMSFCEETETYLLGCQEGEIYAYNISGNLLQKFPKHPKYYIKAITFLHSDYFAFSTFLSGDLHIGNLLYGKVIHCSLNKYASVSFCRLPKKNLLLSSLGNGSLVAYRINHLPRLRILYSTVGRSGEFIEIHNVKVHKKEYIVTNGTDQTIRIWHIIKGKIRLLRVIRLKSRVYSMVYLENYKILAIVQSSKEVKFLSLPSGKIEKTLDLDLNLTRSNNIFLMKDKNAIGVASSGENVIRIVQLHGGGQEVK